jgi:DNA-binding MurR/RpiR family transcriptional regulator
MKCKICYKDITKLAKTLGFEDSEVAKFHRNVHVEKFLKEAVEFISSITNQLDEEDKVRAFNLLLKEHLINNDLYTKEN